ncbi:alpha-ketoacid dehydrogenase subunit beta [Sansalvadorimonas sp. 2012CJ34-2]|uniref:3-methyl-2-oxobutanoate dehydrogenase (2-methylpropanoyl-transferring) n=1 Tax=Parendozoicomonas callyspongiae TaxID=2942213 RepID=A0ABT0PEF8_9GAMM|nr:alpha-ketoacid dehydrogenase subunit beta [Sansalvadorimonas sp. 2012CJ34-2]MCL6269759.1 alpha-ketoacid dehydrogenase subunit beta [Sansalvadorimonas sp. 2012CJ34-2]
MSDKKTLVEAVNTALDHAMADDKDVVLLGEDIGANGGVFRATQDLKSKYGLKRVMDTPLAETLIAGMTVGMAAQGLKPVAEIQFMGFIFACMEQLVTHAARMRNRTRGRLSCPMVLRAPFGGGIHAPEHHSESTEALLAHIPGLRVVIPSSPVRAYGLLRSAIDSPDPVIFLEPKRIYRVQKQTLPETGSRLPLDTCFTLREGSDVTLVTWGACVRECQEACNTLAEQGVSVELIDVATIKPLDMETILASTRKTGRCVIVHEAARSFGVGAEIAARIFEDLFFELKAPVKRVAGYDITMPYYRMEEHYIPDHKRIVIAIHDCLTEP